MSLTRALALTAGLTCAGVSLTAASVLHRLPWTQTQTERAAHEHAWWLGYAFAQQLLDSDPAAENGL